MSRSAIRWLLVALTLALALFPMGVSASPRPDVYTLPGSAVYPEGIAFQDATGYFYVSSTSDGSILRGHVKEAAASMFLPGGADGRTIATGMKVDSAGRLFVSGATSGKMFVYDTATKALLASFTSSRASSFINDVALAPNGDAYFTDSFSPVIYRVFRDAGGAFHFEEWLDLAGTAIVYAAGFNLNGIIVTPDGRYLIVDQTNTGKLFRITLAGKAILPIDLGGGAVPNGDGLLLKGRTLYAVSDASKIARVQLSGDLAHGRLLSALTDDSFAYPTTIADARGRLLVVNSQFDKRPTSNPVLPFSVSSLRLR